MYRAAGRHYLGARHARHCLQRLVLRRMVLNIIRLAFFDFFFHFELVAMRWFVVFLYSLQVSTL